MAIIRKLSLFDKSKVKTMISFLSQDEADKFVKRLINNTCDFFHYWLPLKFKFMPESYVLIENKDLHGMITISPIVGNSYKLNITKLLFERNYYDIGKQLIEYIIARYGAKGAQTFMVAVDESHDELVKLFIDGCGFRQCSCENLWRINREFVRGDYKNNFRRFRNSDAQAVAMLFNDSVINHFKPSLLKTKDEYYDFFCKGLTDNYEMKFVMEDVNLHTILAYFSVKTFDEVNYTLEITTSNGYEINYEDIISFVRNEITSRKKEFYLFIKSKKYTIKSDGFEKYLEGNGFKCVQSQMILVKDFYKLIKQELKPMDVILFNEAGHPVFRV